MKRRDFLKGLGCGAGVALLPGCSTEPTPQQASGAPRPSSSCHAAALSPDDPLVRPSRTATHNSRLRVSVTVISFR